MLNSPLKKLMLAIAVSAVALVGFGCNKSDDAGGASSSTTATAAAPPAPDKPGAMKPGMKTPTANPNITNPMGAKASTGN
jgi:hypothetical protein